jgi:hypothetical protein
MSTELTAQEAEEFRRLYGEDIETEAAPVYTPPPSARRRPNRRCSVTETVIRQQQEYERNGNQWVDPSEALESWASPSYTVEGPAYEAKCNIYPTKDEGSLFSQMNYANSWNPNGSNSSMDYHGFNAPRSARSKYPRTSSKTSKPEDFPDPWASVANTAVPEEFPDPWTPRAA